MKQSTSSLVNVGNVTIGNPGIVGRIMLEHILNMLCMRMWTRFVWILIGSIGELLLVQVKTSSVKGGEILY
jgi:hypothetical protein